MLNSHLWRVATVEECRHRTLSSSQTFIGSPRRVLVALFPLCSGKVGLWKTTHFEGCLTNEGQLRNLDRIWSASSGSSSLRVSETPAALNEVWNCAFSQRLDRWNDGKQMGKPVVSWTVSVQLKAFKSDFKDNITLLTRQNSSTSLNLGLWFATTTLYVYILIQFHEIF